jgi:hypothetical protein
MHREAIEFLHCDGLDLSVGLGGVPASCLSITRLYVIDNRMKALPLPQDGKQMRFISFLSEAVVVAARLCLFE